jgi:hypothetical protein
MSLLGSYRRIAATVSVLVAVVAVVVLAVSDDEDGQETAVVSGVDIESGGEGAVGASSSVPGESISQKEADRREAAERMPEYSPEPGSEEEKAYEPAAAAQDKMRAVGRQWYVQSYANVRAGLEASREDENLTELCEWLSSDAQAETIEYARESARLGDIGEWNCEMAIGLMIRRTHQNGSARIALSGRVVGMNIEGDRATATLDFGARRPLSSAPLVKEDGEWKLGSSPAKSDS